MVAVISRVLPLPPFVNEPPLSSSCSAIVTVQDPEPTVITILSFTSWPPMIVVGQRSFVFQRPGRIPLTRTYLHPFMSLTAFWPKAVHSVSSGEKATDSTEVPTTSSLDQLTFLHF